QVFSLENRKQQLAMSMAERRAEVAVHAEMQRAALKAADEERHRLVLELGQRRQAVEKLRAKHEALVKSFRAETGGGGSEDGGGGGSEHSQAYFVIAAAQRREELQREGDELDGAIHRAEREMRALANTLQHLQRADPTAPEAEQLRRLEARGGAAADAAFRRRRELHRLE
ncbi:unnamed protein product, partial [Phaeothamnion confervicola]